GLSRLKSRDYKIDHAKLPQNVGEFLQGGDSYLKEGNHPSSLGRSAIHKRSMQAHICACAEHKFSRKHGLCPSCLRLKVMDDHDRYRDNDWKEEDQISNEKK